MASDTAQCQTSGPRCHGFMSMRVCWIMRSPDSEQQNILHALSISCATRPQHLKIEPRLSHPSLRRCHCWVTSTRVVSRDFRNIHMHVVLVSVSHTSLFPLPPLPSFPCWPECLAGMELPKLHDPLCQSIINYHQIHPKAASRPRSPTLRLPP